MIKNLSKPFKWFFQLEAASGLVLLIAAIIALVISNSSLSNLYFDNLSGVNISAKTKPINIAVTETATVIRVA